MKRPWKSWIVGIAALAIVLAAFHFARAQAPEALVDEAIDALRGNAYYASRVDWTAARAEAIGTLDHGGMPADAIRTLVRALGDGHSFYIAADTADRMMGNRRTDDLRIEGELRGRHGYLVVPAYVGNEPSRMAAFANGLRERIAAIERRSPCGWIVDLRRNGGGNMGPMLSGLRPLLGEGALGAFVTRTGAKQWTAGELDAELSGPDALTPVSVRQAPVAVLFGPGTVSSGEAVAVSFIGRPATRSFGEPTAGKSSGNRGIRLADGSMLLVMAGLMADRDGHLHGGRIDPDEFVVAGSGGADAVFEAARRWVEKSGCAPQEADKEIK